MQAIKTAFRSKDGSVLVGAVALTTIMALGVAGLMGVSRNTSSQEMDAHDDALAYLAAEAGLTAGANWMKKRTSASPLSFDMEHDGIPVTVRIEELNPPAANKKRLTSTADVRTLSYYKRLEWTVEVKPGTPSGGINYVINGSKNSDQHELRVTDVFWGPVHFNKAPIGLKNPGGSNANSTKFHGPVTVTECEGCLHYANNYGQGMGGNYNEGVWVETGSSSPQYLDQTFLSRPEGFKVVPESYDINFTPDPSITVALDENKNSADARLRFGVRADGTTKDPTYVSFGAATREEFKIPQNGTPMIIETKFPITVTGGTMNGIVTVRAYGPGNQGNIMFDLTGGDLTSRTLLYGDMYTTNITGFGNEKINGTNMSVLDNERSTNHRLNVKEDGKTELSVITTNGEGDEKKVYRPNDVLAFYSDEGNIIVKQQDKGYCSVITAQLSAYNGTIIFSNNITATTKNTGFNEMHLRVIGALILGEWWGYSNSKVSFSTLYDQRKPAAAGMGYLGAGTTPQIDEGQLIKSNWKETNIPRGGAI